MPRFVFMLNGYADTAADLEANVNGIAGKQMMMALRHRLAASGYECDPQVWPEDWGWYFGAARNGRRYLCGGQVDKDADNGAPGEAQAFLDLERSLLDRIFGRNKQDPTADPGADLRTALVAMPGVAGLTLEED